MLRNNTKESMQKWSRLRELTKLKGLIEEMNGTSPLAVEFRQEEQKLHQELMEFKNPVQEFSLLTHI